MKSTSRIPPQHHCEAGSKGARRGGCLKRIGERSKRRVVQRRTSLCVCLKNFKKIGVRPRKLIVGPWNKRRGSQAERESTEKEHRERECCEEERREREAAQSDLIMRLQVYKENWNALRSWNTSAFMISRDLLLRMSVSGASGISPKTVFWRLCAIRCTSKS